ncbi:MAG: hypothetical protein HOO86_10450 [Bacteroidales bacterium]|nr:hypothetical protein [Bacteroidales bacterium]
MKPNPILLSLLLLLSCLTISSCKKDKDTQVDAFCNLVEIHDYEGTGPMINDFLAGLGNESQDKQLIKLKEWMESKSCVDSAVIVCNSCIYTYPAQSELRIVFITQGRDTTMTMDILMSEPLKFRTFHE